jgi:hypothetical protein
MWKIKHCKIYNLFIFLYYSYFVENYHLHVLRHNYVIQTNSQSKRRLHKLCIVIKLYIQIYTACFEFTGEYQDIFNRVSIQFHSSNSLSHFKKHFG